LTISVIYGRISQVRMDFIERFFHVSPDGGNGLTELYWFAVAPITVAVVFRRNILRTAKKLAGLGRS
jgi:hypothetical protein